MNDAGVNPIIVMIVFQLMTTFIASIIPMIVAGIASNAEHDLTFKSYFSRPDADIYFTDKKVIEMRNKYSKEYNDRFAIMMILVAVFNVILFSFQYTHVNNLPISDSTASLIGVLSAITYVMVGSYIAALTGASSGRLEATRPLLNWQKDNIRKILSTSTHTVHIRALINSNPKNQLAQIDYLHIKHVIKKLEKRKLEAVNDLVNIKL